MSVPGLVLDLFPGIGLLARAFEQEGYCVVSGPDLIFGGDVRTFHPPAGVFEGVIGGPPCQAFSRLRHLRIATGQTIAENLIPEYERVVALVQPDWFVMENVPDAPEPVVAGYLVHSAVLNNRWAPEAPEQHRRRRISFGTPDGRPLVVETCLFHNPTWHEAILAGGGSKLDNSRAARGPKPNRHRARLLVRATAPYLAEAIEQQGLPPDFLAKAPFTIEGKVRVVGNGVPLPLGRMVAAAVRRAIAADEEAVAP